MQLYDSNLVLLYSWNRIRQKIIEDLLVDCVVVVAVGVDDPVFVVAGVVRVEPWDETVVPVPVGVNVVPAGVPSR